MVRIWLVISLVISSCVFGEEKLEVVSYYLSKEHAKARFARLIATESKDLDSNEEPDEMPTMERLANAPFQSRFIEEDHRLLEVTSLFAPVIENGALGFRAVLNETTGRLVVRGSKEQQFFVKQVVIPRNQKVKIRNDFDLYLLPRAPDLKSIGCFRFQPDDWRKLKSVTGFGESGDTVEFNCEKNELNLEVQAFAEPTDSLIYLRWGLNLNTKIQGERVKVRTWTHSHALSGVPRLIDLGSFGSEGRRLCLVWKVGVELSDGTSIDDLVAEEILGRPFHYDETETFVKTLSSWNRELDFEEGLGAWSVPPTFLAFLERGAEKDESVGTANETDIRKRYPVGPGGMIEITELFRLVGVELEKQDKVYFFDDRGQLFARSNPKALGQIGSICIAGGPDPPARVRASVGLVEYSREPDLGVISEEEGKLLSHGTVTMRRGSNGGFSSKSKGQLFELEMESQTKLDEDLIEIRLGGVIRFEKNGKKTPISETLSVKDGETSIISKMRHAGKWRAVVIRSEIEEISDELPKEEK